MSTHTDDPQQASGARRNFLTWAAGIDAGQLNGETERVRASSIGALSIVAALLAAGGMGALTSGVGGPFVLPFVSAAAVGVLVFFCNRAIGGAARPRRSGAILIAVPQLVLGVIVGIVVAQGLSYVLFDSEIDRQVAIIHENELSDLDTSVAARAEFVERREAMDRDLATAEQSAVEATKAADVAYTLWQNEIGGVVGVGPGVGPEARVLESEFDSAVSGRSQTTEALDVARNMYTDQLRALDADIAAAVSNASADIESDNGVLIRAHALEQITNNSPVAATARWVLFALVVLILLMPSLLRLAVHPAKSQKP